MTNAVPNVQPDQMLQTVQAMSYPSLPWITVHCIAGQSQATTARLVGSGSTHSSGGCQQSSNNAPFWVKVNSEIITTSSPISDILDLQTNHPSLAPFGWDFGQQSGVSNSANDALVINSVHSITEDQIHMHVCHVNTGMKNFLGSLTPSQYYDLKDIQIVGEKIYCRASHSPGQPVSGDVVSADINTVMGQECKYYVGAAVLRDKNDLAWSCITADHVSTEYKRFCA
ncbi:hypothetical protein N7454_003012 [Penicillium verhagenii]|nr:hypothetical protein N7454_003012 [Penicillium verhagenii]